MTTDGGDSAHGSDSGHGEDSSEAPHAGDVHEADRRRASERPVVGAHVDFALEVRRLLGWEVGSTRPFLSTRAAYLKTGVSNGSVNSMSKGQRPSSRTVEAFAQGLGADADHLKRLAGHVSPDEARRLAWSRRPPPESLEDAGLAGIGEEQALPDVLDEQCHGLVAALYAEGTRAVWVRGDSLLPLYRDGDLVFVLPADHADPGREVVCRPPGGVLPSIGIVRDRGVESPAGGALIPDARVVGVVEGYMRFAPSHPIPSDGAESAPGNETTE